MKIVCADIESTGLDEHGDQNYQMIELALIVEDTLNVKPLEELPRFSCYIAHPSYTINAALAARNDVYHTLQIIEKISKVQEMPAFKIGGCLKHEEEWYFTPETLDMAIFSFLEGTGLEKDKDGKLKINIAGKNAAGMDIPFMKKTMKDWKQLFNISHRTIDVGNFFLDVINDKEGPSLAQCKERVGFSKEVAHDAFSDALDVVKLLRAYFNYEIQS